VNRIALPQDNASRNSDSFRRWGLVGAPAIVLAVAAVYANSFAGVFVLDDNHAIVRNMDIRRLTPVGPVLRSPRPVLSLSLALNYRAGGLNLWGYHAANLAIHVVAALALYGVLRRTFRRRRVRRRLGGAAMPAALAIALIWAVHPLQTGAVTYVIQRAESMMGMFFLLTLYCAIRGMSARTPVGWFAAAALCCALAMGAKEVAVVAPLIVLAWDRVFRGRSLGAILRRRRLLYVLLAAAWVVILVRLTMRPGPDSAGFASTRWTPVSYALTQPGVILRYLGLAFVPVGQCLDYAVGPARGFGQIVPPAVAVAAIVAATVWALRRRPAWGFAGLWLGLILAPTSSVMPISDAMFEHRMYLPLAAVVSVTVVAAVLLARRVAPAWRGRGVVGMAAAVAVTAVLGVASVRRNALYHDELAMYRDVVAKAPHNARAHRNLGVALDRRGRTAEGLVHLAEAVRLQPDSPYALNNYAFGLRKMGRTGEAIAVWEKALSIKPDLPEALHGVGVAYTRQGRYAEALDRLGGALAADPHDPAICDSVGVALASAGRPADAVPFFRRALELDPRLPDAHYCLGRALAETNRPLEAADEYRRQLALDADHLHALNGLARVMATSTVPEARDPERALAIARRVCKATGSRFPLFLSTLAAAEAATGRYTQAAETIGRAIALAEHAGRPSMAAAFRRDLELYRQGRPLREPAG